MKRATTNNLFEAKQVHITLCVCCKFGLFLHQRSLDIFFSINIWGEISGILLQVFVATCNKDRGLTHCRGDSGGYVGGVQNPQCGIFQVGDR